MASLSDLATELKLLIVDHLDPVIDFATILHLSCTCRLFRALAAPKLFKTLVLRNNDRNAASIQTLANSPYKDLVYTFHYQGIVGILPGGIEDGPETPSPPLTRGDLLDSVRPILSKLRRFPKLEKLIVELPLDDDDLVFAFSSFSYGERLLLNSAEDHAYRDWGKLNEQSYGAVAANHPSSIKHLELKDVIPVPFWQWKGHLFHDFLGSLESFTLTLRGGTGPHGIIVLRSYTSFARGLNWIWYALKNVRNLSFGATSEGPLGLAGGRHVPLPLQSGHMPQLQTVELQWCFISLQLAHFIRAHRDTLTSIRLTNCYSGDSSESVNGIPWARFLSIIAADDVQKLVEISILPLSVPIRDENTAQNDIDYEKVERELRTDPTKRLFGYGYLSAGYGAFCADPPMNYQEYILGEDQQAWNRLMAIVNRNASRDAA